MKNKLLKFAALLLLVGGLAACKGGNETAKEEEIVKNAAEYVWGLYSEGTGVYTKTGSFDVVNKTVYDGETVAVEWNLTVKSGSADGITFTKGTGAYSKVNVYYYDGLITEETTWDLTASFTYGSTTKTLVEVIGEEKGVLHYTTPRLVLNTRADWESAVQKETVLNIKGVVLDVLKNGSGTGSFYFQDANGFGYYAYKPAGGSPSVGDVVVVTGKRSDYSGQQEFGEGCTWGKVAGATQDIVVNNATADFEAAANNKTFDAKYQNNYVELKNCKAVSVSGSYYYFTVGEGKAQYNIYDNYYFLSDEQREAFKTAWNGAVESGASFTVKGISTVYSSAIQIYGSSNHPEIIYDLKALTAEEKLASVEAGLKAAVGTDEFLSEAEIILPIPAFATVKSFNIEGTTIAFADNKLTITPAGAKATNKLTLVVEVETQTKTIELTIVTGALLPRPVYATSLEIGVPYRAVMLYATGNAYVKDGKNGSLPGVTYNPTEATTFKVERHEGSDDLFDLVVVFEGKAQYFSITLVDGKTQILWSETEKGTGWKWNETFKTLTYYVNETTTVYLGSYDNSGTPAEKYQRVGNSAMKYINADNMDVTQFPLHFVKADFRALNTITAADKDTKVKVCGVVVGFGGYNNNYFIKDASGVGYVYRANLKDIKVGTYIEAEVTVDVYSDLVELTKDEATFVQFLGENVDRGEPVTKTCAEYMEVNTVEANGVYFKLTGGTFGYSGNYINLYYPEATDKYVQTDTLGLADMLKAAGFTLDTEAKTITAPEGTVSVEVYGYFTGKSKGNSKIAIVAVVALTR